MRIPKHFYFFLLALIFVIPLMSSAGTQSVKLTSPVQSVFNSRAHTQFLIVEIEYKIAAKQQERKALEQTIETLEKDLGAKNIDFVVKQTLQSELVTSRIKKIALVEELRSLTTSLKDKKTKLFYLNILYVVTIAVFSFTLGKVT